MSAPAVATGRREVTVRLAGDRLSARLDVRTIVVCVVLLAAAAVVAVFGLGLGTVSLTPAEVVDALLGGGRESYRTLVVDFRLPRICIALVFGAALGVSGAIFQSLTRNPLGSPDIIGFDAGAYTGAVLVIVLTGGLAGVVAGALIGGAVTALVVYLLAFTKGVQGFRLIVVGIAITAMLGSLNTYLIVKADLYTAQLAAVWGAGSLTGLSWDDLRTAGFVLMALLVPLAWFGPRLRYLEMGDDAARALGRRVEWDRVALLLTGVGLTATVTAMTGPIAFVALCAPQISRRLTRATGPGLVASACLGSLLLLSCDLAATNVFAPTVVPVGLTTIVLGGAYLVWLIFIETRRGVR